MKFYETHFEEYINAIQKQNLHPKLEKIYKKFPETLQELKNVIIYGPSGVGKYTQMLKSIKKYSPSELKYDKKISVTFNKQPYFFKISDIHYEIDMSLLGCHSKLLWHDIYQQILDILSAKNNKTGIIVCKDFHNIHSELLENFYSYMQDNNSLSVNIKYILLTEVASFIPDSILNCCEIINISRPTKMAYTKCSNQKFPNDIQLEQIINIKHLHTKNYDLMHPYKIICDNEADLPNWGVNGPSINENTAIDFVNSHENCHFADDWEFQWAYYGTSNPGNHIAYANGWNTFGPDRKSVV